MIPITDALIDEMVEAIVAEVDPEQVILFGSRARGRSGKARCCMSDRAVHPRYKLEQIRRIIDGVNECLATG